MKVDTLTEMLGLLIRRQVVLVAHQPPLDIDTALLGRMAGISCTQESCPR
ncbi:hypothetical protein [Sphingobium sp. ZW T5_29]